MTATPLASAAPDVAAVRVRRSWAGPVDLPLRGEADVQAACGVMHVHGRRYGGPTLLPIGYCACAAEVLAAQARLAARCSAELGRPVRRASTSAAQAALLVVGQHLAVATAADDDWIEPQEPGGPPFTSRDGVRYEIECLESASWAGFWAGLGAPDHAVARGWRPFQHRFATATCPLPAELFATAAAADFLAASRAASESGASVAALLDASARKPVPVDRAWRVRRAPSPAMPPRPGSAAGRPCVVACDTPGPLAGITVVECTRRVQGPLAGHLLGQLGARVVRVEPPGGDPLRGMPPIVFPADAAPCSARFHALNRGKEVVEADLSTAAGRDELRDLVAGADIFLHNWAPGKATEWGLDDADLARVRPSLVYAWASGWFGAPGQRHPTGTDYLVQARSGLAHRLAPPGRPATPSLLTLIDVLGALVSVEGVLTALLTRLHTGCGARVDSSLYTAARLAVHRAPTLPPDTAPGLGIEPLHNLADLAADPRFAEALETDGCALVRAPWEFSAC